MTSTWWGRPPASSARQRSTGSRRLLPARSGRSRAFAFSLVLLLLGVYVEGVAQTCAVRLQGHAVAVAESGCLQLAAREPLVLDRGRVFGMERGLALRQLSGVDR